MTQLTLYPDDSPEQIILRTTDVGAIARHIHDAGARFEQWEATVALPGEATSDQIMQSYAAPIERLKKERGYRHVDVVRFTETPSDLASIRKKFLVEHTHAEDEVRFFVAGSGLFLLHVGANVLALFCERGDLLSVPAGLAHWFDMGSKPFFTCIRLFTDPAGWAANYTGNTIANRFPALP